MFKLWSGFFASFFVCLCRAKASASTAKEMKQDNVLLPGLWPQLLTLLPYSRTLSLCMFSRRPLMKTKSKKTGRFLVFSSVRLFAAQMQPFFFAQKQENKETRPRATTRNRHDGIQKRPVSRFCRVPHTRVRERESGSLRNRNPCQKADHLS